MNRLFKRPHLWYKILFPITYVLPIITFFVFTVIILGSQGIVTLLGSFLGSSIVGMLVFFPFGCIYYAALTFIQTFIDQILYGKRKIILRILIITASFICSALLAFTALMSIESWDNNYGIIYYIMMLCIWLVSMALTVFSYLNRIYGDEDFFPVNL